MRTEQPLAIKLEHVMKRFIRILPSSGDYKWLKEKFPIPIKNEETGLLKWDSTNPFYEKIWPKTSKIYFFLFFFFNYFRKKELNWYFIVIYLFVV